jgi:pimeloyl-ACP methyl ester carboxylesterase
MIADVDEMAARARKTVSKDKIFVSGHSWGSYLGLELARRHPDWLHAYIGVGQMSNMPESERRGWHFAMDAAHRRRNVAATKRRGIWQTSRLTIRTTKLATSGQGTVSRNAIYCQRLSA